MSAYRIEPGLGGTTAWALLLCLSAGLGCGDGGSSEPQISQRSATSDECAAGGTVLAVDGTDVATVCNGTQGPPGEQGLQGVQGIQGDPGANGEDGAPGAPGETNPTELSSSGATPSEVVGSVLSKAAAIVIVECTDGDTWGDGSGTKTDTGTVLTAMHVLDGMKSCNIYSQAPVALLGSMKSSAQRGSRDEVELTINWSADGAAIAGVAPTRGVIPKLGDLVTIVGHPGVYDGLSLEHQYTTGFVTATDLSATLAAVPTLKNAGLATRWAQSWSTDAISWHGNSGGPVFDAQGRWIGVLVGGFNGDSRNEGPDLSVVLPLF
jgi:S1-C subfamily serine protease